MSSQVVLVARGADEIGAPVSEALHAAGDSLVLTHWTGRPAAEALAARLAAELVRCDPAQDGSGHIAAERALARFGRLDAVVLVPAPPASAPLVAADLARSQWEEALDANLVGLALFARSALRAAPRARRLVVVQPVAAGNAAERAALAGLLAWADAAAWPEVEIRRATVGDVARFVR